MVSNLTIFGMVFTALLCITAPTIAFVFVKKREKFAVRGLIAGILSFFVLQMLIRIPILTILPSMSWYVALNENILGISIFLGLTAALFETAGRYLFIRFMLKGKESYGTGLAHGIGHGGIEALLLVGINYIVYVLYAIMINNGNFDALATGEAAEAMATLKDTLITTNSVMFFVAGTERFLTMIIHVGLSVLVMEGFVKKDILKYSLVAIAVHGALDFLAVYMQLSGVNVFFVELMVLTFALGMGYYIYKAKDRFKEV